jgi:hypothetical protein
MEGGKDMGTDTLEQLTLFDIEEEYILKEGEHFQECVTCNKKLPLKSFNTIGMLRGASRKQGLKNNNQYYYLDRNCKVCDSNERINRHSRRKLYSSPKNKDYKCPICERDSKTILNWTYRVDQNYNVYEPNHKDPWCLDHDHDTGDIRGWLCHKCNTSLGGFKDKIYYLDRAKKYLKGDFNGSTGI